MQVQMKTLNLNFEGSQFVLGRLMHLFAIELLCTLKINASVLLLCCHICLEMPICFNRNNK